MKGEGLNKCRRPLVALIALVLLVSEVVFAQQAPHVCGTGPGPNEVMAGMQPAGPGIAPTPLCYWKSGAGQAGTASQARWEDRWGAIAADDNAIYGIVKDRTTKRQAQRAAIDECERRGGVGCRIQLAYYNQCAAVIVGATGSIVSNDATEEVATNLGIKDCEKLDGVGACRVYYSGCSLPAQVR